MAFIPLSAVPLILYVIAALFLYDAPTIPAATGDVALHPFWDSAAVIVTLVSGQRWALTYSDCLVIVALTTLLLTTLRAANGRDTTVIGNMLGVLTLCAYIIMFLTLSFAGTSLFFILAVIALVETLTTLSVSMVASHSKVEPVPD